MLNVIMLFHYPEHYYVECHYAERRYAERRYAERRYAECRYDERRYAERRWRRFLVFEILLKIGSNSDVGRLCFFQGML